MKMKIGLKSHEITRTMPPALLEGLWELVQCSILAIHVAANVKGKGWVVKTLDLVDKNMPPWLSSTTYISRLATSLMSGLLEVKCANCELALVPRLRCGAITGGF